MQDRVTKYIVPLPSIILELSTRPYLLSPSLVLKFVSGTKFQLLPHFDIVGLSLGLTRNLGAHQVL
jgi:hypothetical protein